MKQGVATPPFVGEKKSRVVKGSLVFNFRGMKQELILTISDLEKLNKIDSQYKSSLYSFNLYKHLYFSRSEKEL
jgi:hypothetical protein